jgi:hypothetical protein
VALCRSATPDLQSVCATTSWSLQATQTLHTLLFLLYQSPQGTGTVKQTQQSYFGVCWVTVKPRYEPLNYKYCTNTDTDRLLHTQTLSTVSIAVWICYSIQLIR